MNEQWSSVGLCVEPQAEQRSLATNQQAAHTEDSSRSTVSRSNISSFQNCPPSSSTNPIVCNSNGASQTPATRPPSRRQTLHANGLQPCLSLPNKVDGPSGVSCKYEPSSPSVTGSNSVLLPKETQQTLADTYPTTSAAGQVAHSKTSYSVVQLRRRRFNFVLTAAQTNRLLRIVNKHPITLKRLGMSSVKAGPSEVIPINVSDAAMSLLSLPYDSHDVTGVTPSTNDPNTYCERGRPYDSHSELGRHEMTPSTSSGRMTNKRKASFYDGNEMYRVSGTVSCGPQGRMDAGNTRMNPAGMSAVKQQQCSANANNSPLLINLLSRSASPGAGAGMPSQQLTRPPTPVMKQRMVAATQAQGSVGYSQYSYVTQGAMGPPTPSGLVRPALGSTEVSQTTTSTHVYSEQRALSQVRQVAQEGYIRSQMPQQQQQQQQPAVFINQQGPPVRPQYIHVQQQARLPSHPMHVQYHQSGEMEPVMVGAPPSSVPATPGPPPKKRKRLTKKQQKEAELAQQAAAAAAAQQQQQFMIEQQMNSRVPPANAHTVDRPVMPQQVMHSEQHMGMVYAQHPQGYPAQNLRSPPAASAPPGTIMQNTPSNPPYYHQQQQVWIPQHQQQVMQQQRPQMIYAGQVQTQWQPGQPHHQRIIFTQNDNVSELSAGSSGSVHTSPMTSRNASIDYSPASQSSNTKSPVYQQQQQQGIVYQQVNQQTPPAGMTFPQPSPSQPVQIGMTVQVQQAQQQVYQSEQQSQELQMKNRLPLMLQNSDFDLQDELGANIADDGGDYNDLDSIEPMNESTDIGAALIASHQQQMQQRQQQLRQQQLQQQLQQQQQQHQMQQQQMQQQQQIKHQMSQQHQMIQQQMPQQQLPQQQISQQQQQQQQMHQQHMQQQQHQMQQQYYGRMIPQQQQNRYEMQQGGAPVYVRQMSNEQQQQQGRQLGFAAGPSTPSYAHQQQNIFMSPQPQPNCSPGPCIPQQPQKEMQSGHFVRQRQNQSGAQLSTSPQSQLTLARTPMSAPPVPQSQQTNIPLSRADDLRSCRSDGEATPRAPTAELVQTPEGDKDPINCTIDAVVLRALSDQEGISSSTNVNCVRSGQRTRFLPANVHSSSSGDVSSTNERKPVQGTSGSSCLGIRQTVGGRQAGQLFGSQTTAHHGSSDNEVGASQNGQPASIPSSPCARSSAVAQQLSSNRAVFSRTTSFDAADRSKCMDSPLTENKSKDEKMTEVMTKAGDRRHNNIAEQHSLTNGHEPNALKDQGIYQCNGMLGDDVNKPHSVTQQAQMPQTKTSTGSQRRNRRKPDLSQETSSNGDDDDEITFPIFGAPQQSYQHSQYVRRMNVSGGIAVSAKGASAASPQASYVNVVQNAQNNFSATIARQQEIMNQQSSCGKNTVFRKQRLL